MPALKGDFVWYELMTSDLDAATKFYSAVVGWTLKDFPAPGFRYVIASAGEQSIGGMMTIPHEAKGMPPVWVGYVGVSDLDAACNRLKSAGGRVDRAPEAIPAVGRFAMVADPQGAMFVLFQPDMADGGHRPYGMSAGRVGWHELMTSDHAAALAFYSGQFGWVKSTSMDMGAMGTYQLFKATADGNDIGGMMNLPQAPIPYWLFYFVVDDIDDGLERITANKGQVVMGPMEVPGGAWIVQAKDPQGALFAIVGMRKGAAS